MSSIHSRIVTTFSASAGNAIAVMGEISGGMRGIGRSAGTMSNQTSMAERQMRAFGTTIRYALAGTAVFALPAAIRQLSNFQEQLGYITAIGQQPGGLPIMGQQLRQLGNDAQEGAVKALTPITDFNQAIINFLSTVQNVPSDQITPIVTDIARAAKLSQISAEDATKAFTTMSVAFGTKPNQRNIHTTAQQFFALTKLAPGGVSAGGQIIQQMGQLAQVTRLAGGGEADLFGLLLSGLRTGIPPSQLGRGLQFMIQTVGLPGQQTKESEQALGSVGIRAGQRMPLRERLNRIFQHARNLSGGNIPNINKIAGLDETTLDDLEAQGGTSKAFANLGITGPGATFLGQVFHRVHALRTALALQGQFNQGTLQRDLARADEIQQGHVEDINNLAKQWESFRRQSRLKEAGIELQRLGLTVSQAFEPIFDLGARGITATSEAAGRHRDATKYGIWGATGLAALLAVGMKMRGAGIGGLLRRAPALGAGINAAETLATGAIPKGTPTDPIWVIVAYQLGGRGRGIPTMQYPEPIGPGRGPGTAGRRFPIPPALPMLGRWGGPAAIAATLLSIPGASGGTRGHSQNWVQQHYPSLFAMGVSHINPSGGFVFREGTPQSVRQQLARMHRENSTGEINRILRDRMTRIYTNQGGAAGASATQIALALQGSVDLVINYNQPDGSRAKKKVHVRTDNWEKPQHRGRPKANRR